MVLNKNNLFYFLDLRLIINLQLTKKTARIVSVDDVTKSHFSCFLRKDDKIILAFYELDNVIWNKGLTLAMIH